MRTRRTIWLLVVGAVLAGCGTTTKYVTQTVTSTITDTVTNTKTIAVAAKPKPKPKPKPTATPASTTCNSSGSIPCAPLGQSQPLTATQEGGETIDVTVTGVQDLSPDQFNTPAAGTHYVGVYLAYHNVGTATYNDSPANEVTLLTNQGNVINGTVATLSSCNETGNFTVGSGQTLQTCVPFEEPNGQTVQYVEVSLDSANDPPAEWAYH